MNRVIVAIFLCAVLAIPLLAAQSSVVRSLRTIQLVGIGDSVGDPANCAPCKSFVRLYGADAAHVLHSQVRVTNLAQTTRLDSTRLLGLVNTDASFKKDLAQASIVTVTIGGNDISACGGPSTNACYIAGIVRVSRNLPKISSASRT